MNTNRTNTAPMVLRVARAIASYIGFGDDDFEAPSLNSNNSVTAVPAPSLRKPGPSSGESPLRLMPSTTATKQQSSHKWRRHPQLRAYEAPLTEDVRQGRHEAVRGLFAARAGATEVATRHFTIAAQCPELDLTAVPGFWNLTRGQMQTAVNAYEAVGRYRDAAALDAQIATIFRPSLVGTTAQPIVPARLRSKAAST